MEPMVLSRTAYYADFVVYAALIAVLTAIAAVDPDWGARLRWLAVFAGGITGWTLLEYLLHRFVLHHLPILADMHAVHHGSPRAYVGTPTWLSVSILWLAIFLPAWEYYGFDVASGIIAGVMTGFLWYGIVHHAIHHRRPRFLASRLTASIHRHLRHHYSQRPRNFGVTTPAWDQLFGTAEPQD
jgi:sterol desaturase/sphingolipid hydroxylase (fatty acid hydroxylase superfamily)